MQMDANTDGKLSKDEVPERLQSLFARADKNQDGALDKEEIMATSRERAGGGDRPGASPEGQGGPGGDFIGQMMERADADKDGKLTGDEIPEFMRERLSQADTNSDGSLDKAELEAIGARMRAGRGGQGGPPGGQGGPGGGRGEGGRRGDRPPVEDDAPKESPKDE